MELNGPGSAELNGALVVSVELGGGPVGSLEFGGARSTFGGARWSSGCLDGVRWSSVELWWSSYKTIGFPIAKPFDLH